MSLTFDVSYEALLNAQRRAEDAERQAARARRDRDLLIEALFDAGHPQSAIADQLGVSQSYVSQLISAQRRVNLAPVSPQQTMQNETHGGNTK